MTTNNLKENYELLKSNVDSMNSDFEKFNNKKIKVAGSRFRNSLLNCKKLCDTLRKQVTENISTLPIKHRTQPRDSPTPISSEEEEEVKEEVVVTQESQTQEEAKEEPNKTIKKKRTRKANKVKPS